MSKLFCLLAITAIVAVRADEDSRLFGGQEARLGQFPHHVQLRNIAHTHKRPFCGGSIIGDRFVLSSLGCVQQYSNEVKNIRVIVGVVDHLAIGVEHGVDKLITHPQAVPGTVDVGVVRVTKPFTLNAHVQIIQLPTADIDQSNTPDSSVRATLTGWGQSKVSR